MKLNGWRSTGIIYFSVVCLCLAAGMTRAAAQDAGQIPDGKNAKVKGIIISRSGNLVKIQDKKSGHAEFVKLEETTSIEREKSRVGLFFPCLANVDVTAMVPGLTIEARGKGNADGQLEATKVKFNSDDFAIDVAEEQQVMANADAASKAQTTADQGVVSATAAQTSANQAQSTADQGVLAAQAAGVAAAADATAVQTVNQRVSDLANYTTVAVDSVYFPVNGSTLDADGKAGLDKLASFIASTTGYRIEIAGYASSSGTSEYNQRLSEERAASVVHYLTEVGNVPVQQIVLPAGYGATHPVADNTVRDGRALNQRVEVKVLVNKGLQEGSPVTAALLN